MNADRVRIQVSDGVADVRMTRAEKHNGLDPAMFAALNEAIDELLGAEPDELRAVVISGAGPSFCSGLDLASFASREAELGGDGLEPLEGEIANRFQRAAYAWRRLEAPVIAAIHGACFGGGLQIALGADIRLVAPDARMSAMEIRYGLVPDMSMTRTLPRVVRDDLARELVFTGRLVEAAEAVELGLATRVADDPVAAARTLAGEIAAQSPAAIRRAKRLLNEALDLDAAASLALEAELQRELLSTMMAAR